MFSKIIKSRKAQTGETLTWIVATIIIIIVLGIAIFIASISPNNLKSSRSFSQTSDVLASKSLYSYLLTKDVNGKIVYEQIKNQGDLSASTGNFAISIFKGLYGGEYVSKIWLGTFPGIGNNNYFGESKLEVKEPTTPYNVFEEIKLDFNNMKNLDLFMTR